MYNLIEFFKNIKGQVFEFLFILLGPLFLYSIIFPSKYSQLLKKITGTLNGIEILLEFTFYSLLFFSLLTLLVYLIILLIKKPIDIIYTYRFHKDSEKALGLINTYHMFFYGALNRISFLFRWTILISGYLFLIDKDTLINFWTMIYNFHYTLNGFLEFLIIILGIIIIFILINSIYISISMIAYKYLYLKSQRIED